MLIKYRKLSPITKLTALLLFLGIVFSYTIVSYPAQAFNSIIITGALLIAVHVLIQYPRLSKLAIISMVQVALIGFVSLLYGGYFGLLFGVNPDMAILTASAALVALSVTIIYLILDKTNGSLLFNLSVAFLILDFSGLAIGLFFGLEYLLSLLISAVLAFSFVYIRARDFNGRKNKSKPESLNVREEVSETKTKVIDKMIKENEWEVIQIPEHDNYWLINTGKQFVIATSLKLTEKVKITKTGYLYKNVPLENVIAELAEEASEISQAYKIPRNKIHFGIIDVNGKINLPARGYELFELVLKKDKTNVKTRMILSSVYGLPMWVEKTPEEKISQAWENFVNRVNSPTPKKQKKNRIVKKSKTTIEVTKK